MITGLPRPDLFPRDETLLKDVGSDVTAIRCDPHKSDSLVRLYNCLRRIGCDGVTESSQFDVGNSRLLSIIGRAYEVTSRRYRPWAWQSSALIRGLEAAKCFGCSAILSTSYPVISHDVASRLARSLSLPWVADIRDPLVEDRSWYYRTEKEKRRLRQAEKILATSADAIINVHHLISDNMASRYPQVSKARFFTILNGYDPSDLVCTAKPRSDRSKFVLSFIGTLHPEMDLGPFLSAVERLCSADNKLAGMLRIRFYGRTNGQLETALATQRLQSISYNGYISHTDVSRVLATSDALLLPVSPLPFGRFTCTGKVFEYIGSKKPILLIGPRCSPAAQVVQEANAGIVVEGLDSGKICNAIHELFDGSRSFERRFYNKPSIIEKYRRDVQAAQLAEILDLVVEKKLK